MRGAGTRAHAQRLPHVSLSVYALRTGATLPMPIKGLYLKKPRLKEFLEVWC